MMKRIIAAVALALMLVAVPSGARAASFESGNELLSKCGKPRGGEHYGFCIGYLLGVYDAINGGDDSIAGWRACAPSEVKGMQIRDIAVAHLRHNPKDRHLQAASLVARALAEAFPC